MPSSVVQSFTYNGETEILQIVYVSGAVYNYLAVPSDVYKAFSSATSKGTYLNTNIKGKFRYRRIREPMD